MNTKSISWGALWWRAARPLAVVVSLLVAQATTLAADTNAPSKISGPVRHHRQLKTQPAGVSAEQHKRDLRARGMNAESLDREEVALYVSRPLTADEVQEYHTRGIEIDTNSWVPPVSGKHPNGFYLAVLPFNQLEKLEADERVTRVETTENPNQLLDNGARAATQADPVHFGTNFTIARNGAGVRIAIADDYLDLSHPDFANNPPFEAYDVTTGTGTTNWGTNVAGPGFHGTHVTGIVVGSGTNSGGLYRGIAPGAQWSFYKLTDAGGALQDTAIIKAVNRSVAANCDIFSLSAGGYINRFLDGSDAMDQAVDAAVAAGVTAVIGAGNQAALGTHDSVSVAPGSSNVFGLNVHNFNAASAVVYLFLLWPEDVSTDNVTLTCTNLAVGESLVHSYSDTSTRNTKRRVYILTGVVGLGQDKVYNLQLQNTAGAGATPVVQCYTAPATPVTPTFTSPDSQYTVFSPALADGAIAVAAYVHRTGWTACDAFPYSVGEPLGEIATFSSRGPRIDGLLKPDVAAPGAMTISTRSSLATVDANVQIPGVSGCSYMVSAGTSMAAPHAAGIAALILQARPGLSPADVRTLMTTTASKAAAQDNIWGWGLLNASNAVHFAEDNLPGVWVSYGYAGVEQGNFGQPFNTILEAAAHAPSAGPAIIPRIRIVATNATESLHITNAVRLESFNGVARIAAP